MVHHGSEYLPTAICETLDSIVSPDVRDRLLRSALRAGGMRELPGTPAAFREFLQGPLHQTLMSELGEVLGAQVMTELGSIVTTAERDVVARTGSSPRPYRSTMPSVRDTGTNESPRPGAAHATYPDDLVPDSLGAVRSVFETQPSARDRAPLSTERAPHPPASSSYPRGTASVLGVMGTASVDVGSGHGLPIVLVASTDPDLVRCFAAWLDPRASVQSAASMVAIVQELERAGSRRVVIVLDAKMPSVKPLAFAALAEELPASTRVVLWGVGSQTYSKMLAVSASVSKWLLCSKSSTTQDVVAHCARIVG